VRRDGQVHIGRVELVGDLVVDQRADLGVHGVSGELLIIIIES
jgi:hypothetical protein